MGSSRKEDVKKVIENHPEGIGTSGVMTKGGIGAAETVIANAKKLEEEGLVEVSQENSGHKKWTFRPIQNEEING